MSHIMFENNQRMIQFCLLDKTTADEMLYAKEISVEL